MLPFPKRPPPPDEISLRSGDFEAVPYYPNAHGHGQGYGQQPDFAAPAPPHSLAPVAMGSERSYGGVATTGPQMVMVRERPSLKWGIMIAVSGALLGGVLGLGLDAKRQAKAAAAALESTTPITTVAAANALGVPAAATPPAAAPVVAPMSAVAAPASPLVIAPPPKPEPMTKAEKRAAARAAAAASAPAPVRHPSFVAAKVPVQKPVVEKPEKADPPEPVVRAKPTKPEKAPPPDKTDVTPKGAPGDAKKVLEDAIKDTTNTL